MGSLSCSKITVGFSKSFSQHSRYFRICIYNCRTEDKCISLSFLTNITVFYEHRISSCFISSLRDQWYFRIFALSRRKAFPYAFSSCREIYSLVRWKINICLSYRWHVAVGFKLERKKAKKRKKKNRNRRRKESKQCFLLKLSCLSKQIQFSSVALSCLYFVASMYLLNMLAYFLPGSTFSDSIFFLLVVTLFQHALLACTYERK